MTGASAIETAFMVRSAAVCSSAVHSGTVLEIVGFFGPVANPPDHQGPRVRG
jgi:hypothetical protein